MTRRINNTGSGRKPAHCESTLCLTFFFSSTQEPASANWEGNNGPQFPPSDSTATCVQVGDVEPFRMDCHLETRCSLSVPRAPSAPFAQCSPEAKTPVYGWGCPGPYHGYHDIQRHGNGGRVSVGDTTPWLFSWKAGNSHGNDPGHVRPNLLYA